MDDICPKRIAIISDVHGNLTALEQALVIIEQQQCDAIYFLGDAVGYFPRLTALHRILDVEGLIAIRGNHEEYLLGLQDYDIEKEPVYQLAKARRDISDEVLQRVRNWPTLLDVTFCGKRVLFVHGSPTNHTNGYVYPDSELSATVPDFVFLGNTHRPFIRRVGTTTYINVGSVGLPRDDGRFGAFCIWNTESEVPEILRFKLDASHEIVDPLNMVHDSVINLTNRRENDHLIVGKFISDV